MAHHLDNRKQIHAVIDTYYTIHHQSNVLAMCVVFLCKTNEKQIKIKKNAKTGRSGHKKRIEITYHACRNDKFP